MIKKEEDTDADATKQDESKTTHFKNLVCNFCLCTIECVCENKYEN